MKPFLSVSPFLWLIFTHILNLATPASYQDVKIAKIKSPRSTVDGSSWLETRTQAWEALGDTSYCGTTPFNAQTFSELAFEAQLQRTALQMDLATKYYTCSIVVDTINTQSWIEVADIIVHDADGANTPDLWRRGLVRFRHQTNCTNTTIITLHSLIVLGDI